MIAYRLSTYGNPLRTEPARLEGRFHGGTEDSPTQYVCLHPLGPAAELMRNADLRAPDQVKHVRERTWALRVDTDPLLEITFDTADAYGITADELVRDDRSPCQALAQRLRDQVPGIIVPSAALPGTRNAILFGERVGSPYLVDPIGAVDVPASITAHAGRPIVALLDVVRFKGEEHAALEAWRRGDAYAFEEPDWELTSEA